MSNAESIRPNLLVITASASPTSRSGRLGKYITTLLQLEYAGIETIDLRSLPPAALLRADLKDPEIAEAVAQVAAADAIIFVTPTYKGSYSGLLKTFIDLLPQYGLRDKIVLPVATGGTIAHVQMLDHALRPVLQTMWPRHIEQGCFVLDRHIEADDDGLTTLADDGAPLLVEVIGLFEAALAALLNLKPELQPHHELASTVRPI